MIKHKLISPPHSIVVLSEPGWGEIPSMADGLPIFATNTCIAIGCRSEFDGPTKFSLGPIEEFNHKILPSFDGKLLVPNRKIALQTVFQKIIIEKDVKSSVILIKIWINDVFEPDNIFVGYADIGNEF